MSAWSKIPAVHAEVSFPLVKVRTVLTNLHCKAITVSFGRLKQMMRQDVAEKKEKRPRRVEDFHLGDQSSRPA